MAGESLLERLRRTRKTLLERLEASSGRETAATAPYQSPGPRPLPAPGPDPALSLAALRGEQPGPVPTPVRGPEPRPRREAVMDAVNSPEGDVFGRLGVGALQGASRFVTGGRRQLFSEEAEASLGTAGAIGAGMADVGAPMREQLRSSGPPSVMDILSGPAAPFLMGLPMEGVAGRAASASRAVLADAIGTRVKDAAMTAAFGPLAAGGVGGGGKVSRALARANEIARQHALEEVAQAEWAAKQADLPVPMGTSPEPGAIGEKGGGGAVFAGELEIASTKPSFSKELGYGIYTTTNKANAEGYAAGRAPLYLGTSSRPRTGREVVSEFVIDKSAKVFHIDGTPADKNTFDMLMGHPDFAKEWADNYAGAPVTNKNLWYAAESAHLQTEAQALLRDEGYQVASHPMGRGHRDYAVWDSGVLKREGDGVHVFRGADASPPSALVRQGSQELASTKTAPADESLKLYQRMERGLQKTGLPDEAEMTAAEAASNEEMAWYVEHINRMQAGAENVARVKGIRLDPPVDNLALLRGAKAKDAVNPLLGAWWDTNNRLLKGVREWEMKARVSMIDRLAPLAPLQSKTGVAAHSMAQLVSGAQVSGETIVMRDFAPVLNAVGARDKKNLEDLMDIYTSSDRAAKGMSLPGGMRGPAGVVDALERLRGEMGQQRFDAIEQAARKLWALHKQWVLDPKRAAGIIDDDYAATLAGQHPHYFIQTRDDFDGLGFAGRSRSEASLSSTGIKAAEGSQRVLGKDRMHAYLNQVVQTQVDIARNDAAKAIAEALIVRERQTGRSMIRLVPKGETGENSTLWQTISFMEGGEVHQAEVPAIIGEVAKGLGMEPDNAFTKIMSLTTKPLRVGATGLNIAFMPVNLIRDAGSILLQEKMSLFSHFDDYWAGLVAAFTKNELYQDASMQRALQGTLQDSIEHASRLKEIGRWNSGAPQWVGQALLMPARMLLGANRIIEQTSRLAVYNKLGREGIGEIERAVRTRNATVDFSKAGNHMRWINQVIPFSNAATQGSINTARAIKEKPWWTAQVATIFSAPILLERANNARFESSGQLPDYLYTSHWVFQTGEYTREDGTKGPVAIMIPKGQVAALLTFIPEALATALQKSNNRSISSLVLQGGIDAAQAISPLNIGSGLGGIVGSNPAVGLAAGIGFNRDPFTSKDIVPQSEQDQPRGTQFGQDTSTLAVMIGQKLGWSPRMIDFAIKEYTAGGGQQAAWAISMGLEGGGFKPEVFGAALSKTQERDARTPVEQWAKAPVVGRFLTTKDTANEIRGWEDFGKVSAEANKALNAIPGANELALTLSVGPAANLVKGAPDTVVELTPQERADWMREYGRMALQAMPTVLSQVHGTGNERRAAALLTLKTLSNEAVDKVLSARPRPTDPVLAAAWDFRQVLKATAYDGIKTDVLSALSPAMRLRYADFVETRKESTPDRMVQSGAWEREEVRSLLRIDAEVTARQKKAREDSLALELGLMEYRKEAPRTRLGVLIQQDQERAAAQRKAS